MNIRLVGPAKQQKLALSGRKQYSAAPGSSCTHSIFQAVNVSLVSDLGVATDLATRCLPYCVASAGKIDSATESIR